MTGNGIQVNLLKFAWENREITSNQLIFVGLTKAKKATVCATLFSESARCFALCVKNRLTFKLQLSSHFRLLR